MAVDEKWHLLVQKWHSVCCSLLNVSLLQWFCTQYHKDARTDKPIRTWYNNLAQTGSLSAGKRTGRRNTLLPVQCT